MNVETFRLVKDIVIFVITCLRNILFKINMFFAKEGVLRFDSKATRSC